jgi:hypothetical protein
VRTRSTLIAVTCVIGASAAQADHLDWNATAAGSVATTDNKNGSPTNGGRSAAMFSDVRPGMLVTYNAPRHIHELTSEVDFLYFLGSDKPNVTFRGGWKAFFLTGPRSEASASLDASIGQLNALDASRPSADNPLEVIPLGRTDTTNVTGSLQHSWQATKFTRIFDRLFARRSTTDDSGADVSTESQELGAALGFNRRFRNHNLVFELGGSYVYLDKQDPMMRQMGSRRDHQLNPRGVAIWQYDIDKKWSSNVDGGLVYVNPVTSFAGRDWRDPYMPDRSYKSGTFPIFGGTLAYTDVWGRATLTARRSVTPNLFIAQNTVNDSMQLTFAMPLKFLDKEGSNREPKVVGIGTAGVNRTQLIDPETANLKGEFLVGRVDFTVAWQPRKGQTVGLRYEFSYQNGDTVGDMIIPSFFRNTFYFTFSLRYPEEVQVRVPRRGQSVRADQGDLAPIGAEPVVVDPAELLEGQQQ